MRALVLCTLLLAASYPEEAAKWRAEYEAQLKQPNGWLSVSGLIWLHEGINTIGSAPANDIVLPKDAPAQAGAIAFENGVASWQGKALKPDDPGPADPVLIGRGTFTIIKRAGKFGVRLKDPEAATRRNFTGTKWFPPSEAWIVKAKWIAFPRPRSMEITNILGMKVPEPSPGIAEFTIHGRTMRLQPVTEDNTLFFMFRDKTSGHETYGAGRFLYSDIPKGSEVELDFNQATNPPCAFTPYATCPLPPRQNTLPIAVEAGEKSYGAHH